MQLKNSKITSLSGGRRIIDGFTSAVQMSPDGKAWEDIKPNLIRDPDGWHIEGSPYYAEVKDTGERLFCPDKNEKSKYIRLPAHQLLNGLTLNPVSMPSMLDSQLLHSQFSMPFPPYGQINIIFTNTGMYLEFVLNSVPKIANKTIDKLTFDVDSNFDISNLLRSVEGLGIPKTKIIDSNKLPVHRVVDWSYKNGQLEFGLDITGMKFPLRILDDIDDQVDASLDDGFCEGGANWLTNQTYNPVGNSGGTVYESWSRFSGIAGLGGTTVNVAYVQVYDFGGAPGNPLTKIYFEDAEAPTRCVSCADFGGRALTAGIDWDGQLSGGWENSPSLVTPAQHLADNYDSTAISVHHHDDGSGVDNFMSYRSYDFAGNTFGMKIHLEVTAGGGSGGKTAAMGAKMIAGKMI